MVEEKEKEHVPGVSPPPREAVAVQGVPWGETRSCGCFGDSTVPCLLPALPCAPLLFGRAMQEKGMLLRSRRVWSVPLLVLLLHRGR